ncbi:hypothetical protein TSST111916_14295 [Tsukamurella strandjordii]
MAAAGMSGGVASRVRRIASCGATKATKAIGPAAATPAEASSTEAMSSVARLRPSRTPRPRATSSPSCTARSGKAAPIAMIAAGTPSPRAAHTSLQSRPSSDPTSQAWARATSRMSARTSIQSMSARISAVMAMPTRISRIPSTPPRTASRYTRAPVTSPPPSANSGRPTSVLRVAASVLVEVTRNTAATPAPAVIPRMSGLASGLRAIDCTIAPDIPSAAPTVTPTSARGSRRSMTMKSVIASPRPISAWSTSPRLSGNSPIRMLRQKATKATATSTAVTNTGQGRQTIESTDPNRIPGRIGGRSTFASWTVSCVSVIP